MTKQSLGFFLFLTAGFFVCAPRAAAEPCSALEISGQAQILKPGSDHWQILSTSMILRGGDKVRTGEKSYVDLSAGSDFSALMRLDADSEIELTADNLTRFFLRRGNFLMLCEEDGGFHEATPRVRSLFQVTTHDITASFHEGGAALSSSQRGTWVRVFSEEVTIRFLGQETDGKPTQTAGEGFKYFIKTSSGEKAFSGPIRMAFSDYTDWQSWMRTCYQRKDSRARQLAAKG